MALLTHSVLIVDDDQAVLYALSQMLRRHDFRCLLASSGSEAIRTVKSNSVDLVLLDLAMPELDGMETLAELKGIDPEMPVIMITGRGDIAAAVRATKLGAYDFITKPPSPDRLVQTIQKALERSELEKSVRQLERSLEWILGKSIAMAPVVRQIRQCASNDAPVVVQGEAGTGKSVVARLVHNLSNRTGLPFRAVKPWSGSLPGKESLDDSEDMPGSSPGKLEDLLASVRDGTLFIDGLDHISLSVQGRLANLLEKRGIHGIRSTNPRARLILGSGRDLRRLANERRLDEELHRFLPGPPIVLPPLRERLEDMRFLAGKFVWKASIELDKEVSELSEDVLDLLTGHSWPGNVRELENVIRRSVLLSHGAVLRPETILSVLKSERGGSEPFPTKLKDTVFSAGGGVSNPTSESTPAQARTQGEDDYRHAMMMSPVGTIVHFEGRLVFANPAFAAIIGAVNHEELYGRNISDFVHQDHEDLVLKRGGKEGKKETLFGQKFLRLDGSAVEVETTTFSVRYGGHDAVMVVVQDATERRRAEETLRTRQKELEDKTASLEDANSALRVLLSHKARGTDDLEKSVVANVKKLVLPYVAKIRAGRLSDGQAAYLDTVESNLNHIISPFLQKMAAVYSGFTPTEIQIAASIRDGKTTKEIAELLNVGTSTVHTHRNSIRAKLGLAHKDVNLRSYLLSLEDQA
jgi:PAS domain S-box-containing protein